MAAIPFIVLEDGLAQVSEDCGSVAQGDECSANEELSPYGVGETQGETTEALGSGGHGCMPGMPDVYCPAAQQVAADVSETSGAAGPGFAAAPGTGGVPPGGTVSGSDPGVVGGATPAAPPGGTAPGGDPAGPGGRRRAAPPPPPAPPTEAEVLAICPDPEDPEIGRDPGRRGLTGLETRLWASPQESIQVGATVRGYAVGCRLTPERWTWDSGDGARYSADRPGGPHPDNPAQHMYETKDAYTLRLTVQWRRETPFGTDTITRTTEEPYRVIEVRSILTG